MRIYIIGAVGSGKSTFAGKLAQKLQIPHYETDNFVWQRRPGQDIRRVEEERDSLFLQSAEMADWIIEGVHIGWTDGGLEQADFIVFLDMPFHLRTKRFILRYFRQKAGLERANYRPNLKMLWKMFGWNRYFEETMKPEFLRKLERYPDKTLRLKSEKEADKFMGQIKRSE